MVPITRPKIVFQQLQFISVHPSVRVTKSRMAPVNQTMKIQLEVSTVLGLSCPATARCRGTALKTF